MEESLVEQVLASDGLKKFENDWNYILSYFPDQQFNQFEEITSHYSSG